MQRKTDARHWRVARTAVMLCAAALLGAAGDPAAASTVGDSVRAPGPMTGDASSAAPSASAAPSRVPPSAVPNEAVAYLMRADGLSQAEAVRRIEAQPDQAATAERLATQLGPDRTAGSYLDRRTGELVVTVSDDAAARMVIAAGARPRMVRHSGAELSALLRRLDALPAAGSTWGVDVERNQVVVTGPTVHTANLVGAGDALAVEAGAHATVPVATQNVHPGLTDVPGDEPCSAGFALRDGLGIFQYMLTAAHCVFSNGAPPINGTTFGDVVTIDPSHDVAAVRNLNPLVHVLGPFVSDHAGGWKKVIGPMSIGTQNFLFCKSGRGSGYSCGHLRRAGVRGTARFGGVQHTVVNLAETDICAVGGDSGGPLVLPTTDPAKVYAAGVTQGAQLYNSTGGPWHPGQQQHCGAQVTPPQPTFSYFQPLSMALVKVGPGLSVITG